MKNSFLTILFALCALPYAYAEEKTDTIEILFRQGKYEISPSLGNNENSLSSLSRIDSLSVNENLKLKKIEIIGSASPEGPVSLNYRLSDNRAEQILSRLSSSRDIPDSIVSVSFIGRDWIRLLDYAKADTNLPYKEETISLLETISDKVKREHENESDHYLQKLKNLKGGVPYSYLYTNIFPRLRSTRVFVDYRLLPFFDSTISTPQIAIDYLNPDSDINLIYPEFENTVKDSRNFYMAIKTNLLYDALALPSLSAEFYLGKNYSIVGNWTYGWWDKDRTHHYWRAYGGDIALRWWFGKAAANKPLTGHHLGIYGGIMTYDFEFGGKGYMGGLPDETLWNRSLRMAGIEYGYSLPIAKRLNLDFTIGIGYLGGKYIEYIPDNGRYLWQSTHKLKWFGPTKAEISLVWLIGKGNFNTPKIGGNL